MISWRVRPGALMRGYGLTYAQAERVIRHHTLVHWRRFGWIGRIALALLLAYVVTASIEPRVGAMRPLLLGGGALGTGLQLWLAQRAAYSAILQEAADLRAQAGRRAG